ncbi:MAG: N-acetylglucosamine-6-phosphate deacetylase [Reyranella sp.]|uniref:N-acetylglucosamine-6-phosphate deacetylase n=1 Tax=Reyranella sp. TaxID=1929291 RepID=UPI003D0EE0D2
MTRLTALSGARIFDGRSWHYDSTILIGDGRILDIVARHAVPADAAAERVEGGMLVPGFIDAQVNGGGGVALNDAPTAETMNRIAAAHRPFGTCRLLPTLVTTLPEVTAAALAAARSAGPAIVGLHLEGPHLDPVRQGVHDGRLMRRLGETDIDRLLAADVGRLLLTIAPEQVEPPQVRRLVDGGAIVSLGHSDARFERAMAMIDAGATGITHLFNAMSPLQNRAAGLVGAALEAGSVWCGVIADGIHVTPAVLRIALRAKRPPGRLFLVTDAMPSVGSSATSFTFGGRTVQRQGKRLTWTGDDGEPVLAGAHLDMASAVRLCVDELDVPLEEALRMASLYPATFLRLDDRHGRIAPGHAADIVHLDAALQVRRTWVSGVGA